MRVITLVLAGLLLAPRAQAADENLNKAKVLFKRADIDYRSAEFKKALSGYVAALQLAPRPSIIFNIAQCHRQLHNHQRALFYYRLYLSDWARENPTAPHRVEVKGHISRLEELVKQGAQRQQQAQPTSAPTVPRTATAAPPPASRTPPGSRSPHDRDAGEPRRSRTWLVVGLSSAGVALASGVAAIALHVKAGGEFETTETGEPNPDYTAPRNAGHALYALAGVAAVASAVTLSLYYFGGSEPMRSSDVAVVPLAGGALVGGTFRF